ncbi:MAG: hypothetical protein NT141_01045 [candidate division WWE3 bacterium]|nr:hypothetical protein [candidate division WWE3 bacterium]
MTSSEMIQKAMHYAYQPEACNEGDVACLQESTSQNCLINSKRALRFLANNYGDNFNQLMILQTSIDSPAHRFKSSVWQYHAYFLACDNMGQWFAGSPANYDPGEDINRLTNFFTADNLTEIIKQIQDLDGGEWPEAGTPPLPALLNQTDRLASINLK